MARPTKKEQMAEVKRLLSLSGEYDQDEVDRIAELWWKLKTQEKPKNRA